MSVPDKNRKLFVYTVFIFFFIVGHLKILYLRD